MRGTHAVLAAEHLPACLAEPSSSLARQLGWAGRWAGLQAPVKFSFMFFFLFYFSATLLNYLKYLGNS